MQKLTIYSIFLTVLAAILLMSSLGCCGSCCTEDQSYDSPDIPSYDPWAVCNEPNPPAFCDPVGSTNPTINVNPTIGTPSPVEPERETLSLPGSITPPGLALTGEDGIYYDMKNCKLVSANGTTTETIPCNYRPVITESGHFLDTSTGNIVDRQGNTIRQATESEKTKILETTIPGGTYLLPGIGYLNPRTMLVYDFYGTTIRTATDEDIQTVKGRAIPQGMTDVGYGYVNPNLMVLYNYDGSIIRTLTEKEKARLQKKAPPGTTDLGYGYYDPATGKVHDYYGKILRDPTLQEILLIQQRGASTQAAPRPQTAPIAGGIPDITVEEDGYIYDMDLSIYKRDNEDAPEDLRWRVTSGDPDKVIVTLMANDKVRFMLIPNATGTAEAVFTLIDTDGMETSQSVNINIIPVNDAPNIKTRPPIISSSRLQYIYRVQAEDVDGDEVTFTLTNKLEGMTIESTGFNLAEIKWQPDKRGLTDTIVLMAKDPSGLKGLQVWKVDVR